MILKGIFLKAILIIIAITIFWPFHHVQAKVAKTLAEFPIFPGAVRDMNLEKHSASSLPNRYVRVYLVNAPIEEVVRYYSDYFRWDIIPLLRFQMFDDQINIYDGKVEKSGLEKKTALAKYRKPFQGSSWLLWIAFVWQAEVDGDENHFDLNIEDEGLSEDWKNYTPRTKLTLLVQEKENASIEEFKKAQEQLLQNAIKPIEDKSKALAKKPPTEKDLDVPVYPGSRFDPELSSIYSSDRPIYYYFTNDSPSKVATFYKQQPKCEIIFADESFYSLKFGNVEISIGNNNFDSSEKSSIIVYL